MLEKRMPIAINAGILVILTIFGVLLSLPMRLLLDTNYYTQSRLSSGKEIAKTSDSVSTTEVIVIPIDYRKLRRCPKFEYKERLQSVFKTDYDGNCTYVTPDTRNASKGEKGTKKEGGSDNSEKTKDDLDENATENGQDSGKNRRMKSIPIAMHTLVTMLVILAIAAFAEALRICFTNLKDSTRADSAANSRNGSTTDNPTLRRFIPRQPMKSQHSFEFQGMHRSALRLLGARPPPLIRRSSFPSPQAMQTASAGGTPRRLSRRQSVESEDDVPPMHHRTHLIRRH